MMEPDFTYRAIVTDIYDGDTMTLDIDLGFGIWMYGQKVRLLGIDTPELRGDEREEGLRVRDWVKEMCPIGSKIVLESYKDSNGKYGRWLARIHNDRGCINDILLDAGYIY